MTWWRRLVGGSSGRDARPTDFLAEALDLEARGDYSSALTSYRLALRERPDDPGVLQNIAIAFSKTGQPEEAIRTYRRALQLDADLAGAHYGLAFLLLKRGDIARSALHLEAFLQLTVEGGEDATSARFRDHAQHTLARLQGQNASAPADVATAHDDAATDTGRRASGMIDNPPEREG